jgi:hypothetical protein
MHSVFNCYTQTPLVAEAKNYEINGRKDNCFIPKQSTLTDYIQIKVNKKRTDPIAFFGTIRCLDYWFSWIFPLTFLYSTQSILRCHMPAGYSESPFPGMPH